MWQGFICGRCRQLLRRSLFFGDGFLKAGGGLSYLATPQNVAPNIAVQGPEIVLQPLKATPEGSIAYENLDFLLEFADEMEMAVVGPGTSLQPETQRLIRDFVQSTAKPVLIDGDGITAIAQQPDVLKKRTAPTILTPHTGEMTRLLNVDIKTIQTNKIELLRLACQQLNAIIVLKGAHSLIGHPDGRIYMNLTGNAGMATAGSGDVLTGTIAAMYNQFKEPLIATRIGVLLHGLAGDIGAQTIGEDGLTAGNILNSLPQAIKYYRQNWRVIKDNYYQKISLL